MSLYGYCLNNGEGVDKDEDGGIIWAEKGLSSKDPFGVAFCYFLGLASEMKIDKLTAAKHFEISAMAGMKYHNLAFLTHLRIPNFSFFKGFGIDNCFFLLKFLCRR